MFGSSSLTCTRPFSPLMMPVTGPTYMSAEALERNETLEPEMRDLGQRHTATATTPCDAWFEAEAHIASGNPTEQLLTRPIAERSTSWPSVPEDSGRSNERSLGR